MARINGWLGTSRILTPTDATRAASVWAWILRKPTEVTLLRGSTVLDAQTVRIENANANEVGRESGTAAKRGVVVFGIQGHDTLADTDIQRGDKFKWNAAGSLANYEVIAVDKAQLGQVQCTAEEIS